jgi:hypothetical protein
MALPAVSIQVENGALGQVAASDDSVFGLLLQGAAPASLALLTPTLITTLADAEALGITSAYDTANTCRVWKHIKEFYDESGSGSNLWIMVVSNAVSMATMCDKAQANYAVKLLNAASGKIRVLGVTRSPAGGYSPDTTANQIDADCVTAITNAQALALDYANNFKPLRVLIEARNYTGTSGSLVTLNTQTNNRVAVLLGDTVTGAGSAVGLALGRLSSVPVQRNLGRVKEGALVATAAYLGTATLESVESTVATIHDKGFITFRRYVGKSGYYFTDDPTCTGATDDYNRFARGRVIDKVITIAYSTFVEEILDEILIDSAGKIETSKAKYYQTRIETAINTAMTANGEISSVSALVDPNQNVLSTNQICVQLRIVPVGYAKTILVKLGFNNPANN